MEAILKSVKTLIAERYPRCEVAILAGSFIRGEATSHSDLDLFLMIPQLTSAYRESFTYQGYPVEAFVHNWRSYQEYFEKDCLRARPSLPQMVSEGRVIRGKQGAEKLKEEATALLEQGPLPWTDDEIKVKQYELSDLLDDFEGSRKRNEAIFIAGELAARAHEFYLRTNRQWIGSGKWIFRALWRYNPAVAEDFSKAFDCFYKEENKQKVIQWIEALLAPYGGRLFNGFSLGQSENE
ncbi:hypothetical protein JOD43_002324 [Pullulanibacillus pueri]|uniref:Nucleotidyltransferase n=1 Tax=Pullulanibacillus pueri TaxID=1437324 RepID=A0A8J2ZUU3_9BACL|nr:nucleotidyltransferase domain-containing protein [Pullulanibacillus pueri]MBM7682151.1 hypothetical protein [Pullulanibacillus pueri]GGH80230.1 nucleotidyltransferase [Pullulanibacillus pueri]